MSLSPPFESLFEDRTFGAPQIEASKRERRERRENPLYLQFGHDDGKVVPTTRPRIQVPEMSDDKRASVGWSEGDERADQHVEAAALKLGFHPFFFCLLLWAIGPFYLDLIIFILVLVLLIWAWARQKWPITVIVGCLAQVAKFVLGMKGALG